LPTLWRLQGRNELLHGKVQPARIRNSTPSLLFLALQRKLEAHVFLEGTAGPLSHCHGSPQPAACGSDSVPASCPSSVPAGKYGLTTMGSANRHLGSLAIRLSWQLWRETFSSKGEELDLKILEPHFPCVGCYIPDWYIRYLTCVHTGQLLGATWAHRHAASSQSRPAQANSSETPSPK
jgi:hypothetical protein